MLPRKLAFAGLFLRAKVLEDPDRAGSMARASLGELCQ